MQTPHRRVIDEPNRPKWLPRADKAELSKANQSCKHCYGLGYWTQLIPGKATGGSLAKAPDIRRRVICKCVRRSYESANAEAQT